MSGQPFRTRNPQHRANRQLSQPAGSLLGLFFSVLVLVLGT